MHGDTERRLELVATAVLGFDQLVTADDPAAESGFERTYRAHHAGLVRFVRTLHAPGHSSGDAAARFEAGSGERRTLVGRGEG